MKKLTFLWLAVVMATTTLAGCQQATPPAPTGEQGEHDHAHGDHAHPEHGPHEGELIELGEEEYHAEFLHAEDSDVITIYLLDGKATQAVSSDAAEVTINAKGKDQSKQFKMTAVAGEPANSQFEIADAELHQLMEEPETELTLVVSIAGKQYRGKFQHDHDHDHDHAH